MKLKQKNIFSRYKLPCIAFAAVGVLYLIYFALTGFYPFGKRSIAWCDLEQQYVPLLMELRGIIRDGGSLLLGKGGAGMSFWGAFLFFISSPLSFLAVFVREDRMIYFINLLTVLKLCLSGSAASYVFKKLFARLPGSFNVILSVMYTVSGYVMMYYQNNMWLDMMIIFPLLLLSMFRLCSKGKWGCYTICLASAMVLNFYISYMLVLFIALSFAVMLKYCCRRENRGRCALGFFAADICAALITAVVWLPSLKQFTDSGRGESASEFFSTSGFFENAADKAVLIMCTSLIAAVLIIIPKNRQLFRRGKGAYFGIMLAVMLVGAFISPVNMLWHTGSYQAYPLRYGFIIVFLGLSAAAVILSDKSTDNNRIIQADGKRKTIMLTVLAVVASAASAIAVKGDSLSSYTDILWVKTEDAVFLVGFGVLAALAYIVYVQNYRKGNISRRFAVLLMTGVMLCESTAGFSVYINAIDDVTARFEQTAETGGKITDEDFYRTKCTRRYFYSNMLEGMGYHSIGHYTSLTDCGFLFTAKQLGYSAYWLDISTNGGTLITDAFLMNEYIIGTNADMNDIYEPYNTEDVLKIYRNPVVCTGAVISSTTPGELKSFEGAGRMESSEIIAEGLFGERLEFACEKPYLYDNLSCTEKDGKISFEITDDTRDAYICYSIFSEGRNELYFNISGNYSTDLREPYFGAADIYVNGKCIEAGYPSKKFSGIIDMGTFENKYVSVKIKVNKDFTAEEWGLYSLDAEKTEKAVNSAVTADIKSDRNKIIITSDSEAGEYVYIPFAYNDGFSAELNGKETEISRVLGSFMAVRLEEGENTLILEFYPQGFKTGAAVSAVGIMIFAAIMIFSKKKAVNMSEKAGQLAVRGMYLLSAGVFAVLYLVSVAAWIILQFI